MRGKEIVVGLLLGALSLLGVWLLGAAEDPPREAGPTDTSAERETPPSAREAEPVPPAEAPDVAPAGAEPPAAPSATPGAGRVSETLDALPEVLGVVLHGTVRGPAGFLGDAELVLYAGKDKRGGGKKPTPAPPVAAVSTDARGAFRFEGLTGGTALRLVARCAGHVPAEAWLSLPAEGALEQDFALAAGLQLEGRVEDQRGVPLAGIDVEAAAKSGPAVRATSAADGRFLLDGLAPGPVWLTARDPRGLHVGDTWVEARAGERGVVLVMVRGASLRGEVRERGQPLAGVRIGLRGADEFLPSRYTTSDSLGAFGFGALEAGEYALHAAHADFFEATLPALAVREAAETWVDVELGRGATVRGVVVDQTGEPLEGARVVRLPGLVQGWGRKAEGWVEGRLAESRWLEGEPLPDDLLGLRVARTGADGRFALPALGDAMHRLVAYAEGYPRGGATVRVADGVDPAPLTIRLIAGGQLIGRVLDPVGLPVAGVEVRVEGASGEEREVSSDAEGRFRVPELAPGRYALTAYAGGWKESDAAARAEATVGAGEEVHVDLVFARGAEVRGRLLADGQPLADVGFLFRLADPDALGRRGTTDGQGRFVVPSLPPGAYDIQLHLEGKNVVSLPAEVPEDAPVVDLGELEVPSTRLAGQIVDSLAEPVEGASVALYQLAADGAEVRLAAHAWSSAEGFVLRGMSGGSYRLRVHKPGYLAAVQELELAAGSTRGELRVVLEEGARLRGKVRLADGAPAPSYVIARCQDGPLAGTREQGSFEPDGSYLVTGLDAGHTYLVYARKDGFAPARALLEIQAGEQTLDLTLGPAAQLELQVVDGGLPVAGAEVALLFPDGGWHGELAALKTPVIAPTTDARGRLVLADLRAESYQLSIRTPSEELQAPLTLAVGDNARTVDLALLR